MIIPELPVTEPCSSCTRDEGEEGAGGAEGSTVGPSGLVTPTSELPCFTDASDTEERVFCTERLFWGLYSLYRIMGWIDRVMKMPNY